MNVRPQTKDKPSPVNFQWDDPFMLDEQLTEDERMIRDTARAYAQDKLLPRVTKAYLEEKVDRDIFHEMGELGLKPAQEISAQACDRRVGRLLRPDRAGRRLRSRRHEDPRREDG